MCGDGVAIGVDEGVGGCNTVEGGGCVGPLVAGVAVGVRTGVSWWLKGI